MKICVDRDDIGKRKEIAVEFEASGRVGDIDVSVRFLSCQTCLLIVPVLS